MSNDQEIKDIIAQLQELQVGQSKLLQRLGQLSGSKIKNNTVPQQITVRNFAIGDRVRIKNPRFLQSASGTVSKINPQHITVTTANGSSIVRAPKNLILLE